MVITVEVQKGLYSIDLISSASQKLFFNNIEDVCQYFHSAALQAICPIESTLLLSCTKILDTLGPDGSSSR